MVISPLAVASATPSVLDELRECRCVTLVDQVHGAAGIHEPTPDQYCVDQRRHGLSHLRGVRLLLVVLGVVVVSSVELEVLLAESCPL